MVTTFYPPYNFGGDGLVVQRLSRALVSRGHQVTVLHDVDAHRVLAGRLDPPEPEDDGVRVVRLRSPIAPLSVLLTQQTGRPVVQGRKIRGLLDREDFDLILYHNISLVGGPGVLAAGSGVKMYMAHEHWLVCPTHVLWRHRREPCTGRQCLRCVVRYRRLPQLWRHTGYLERQLRHVDLFLAMSEFSRDKHYEFGFPREMEVIGAFVPDLAAGAGPAGDDPPRPHDRPYFLFVGRLERLKGLDDVIPVFREYGDADLLIVGDGPYRPTLEAVAGDGPSVRFVGRVEPELLDAYYRNALALIAPSIGFETFGLVLIEAFRQATPVIARRTGPFPEIVNRCGGGELFSTAGELLAAMQRMQHEPELRQRRGDAGRRGFERYWSESVVMPRFLEVIRRTALVKGRTDIAQALADGAGA